MNFRRGMLAATEDLALTNDLCEGLVLWKSRKALTKGSSSGLIALRKI